MRIISNVVNVYRENNVRRIGGRLWTKWRVTDCQRKCWILDPITVARLEDLRREDKIFTEHGTGPIGPYRSKRVEEEDVNVYYPCCVNTVVTKCVCVNGLFVLFLRRR